MRVLFKPASWGAHVLMVLGVSIAVVAGLWQYHTWSGDRAAAARDLTNASPVPLSSLMGGDSPFPGDSIGQPVTFRGTWLPKGTVYVSGQFHAHRRGYWAVTPVLIGRSAIPVVRGWAPRPTAPSPTGEVALTGWLEPSEPNGEADANPHDDIITSMRIPSITQQIDKDLYSAYVVARSIDTAGSSISATRGKSTGKAMEGLVRVGPTQQPDVSGFTGLRNLLYALQWWVFGVLAIYIWYRWCQDQLHPRDDGDGDEPDDADALPSADPEGATLEDPPVRSTS